MARCAWVLVVAAVSLGGLSGAEAGPGEWTPESVERGLLSSAWTTVGERIETRSEAVVATIWPVVNDDPDLEVGQGGAVVLYQCDSSESVAAIRARLDASGGAALLVSGHDLLVAIVDGEAEGADRDLLNGVLKGVSSGGGANPMADLLARSGESAAPLPPVVFGGLGRAEIVHQALNLGWGLDAAPEVTVAAGYTAVSYRLSAKGRSAVLTIYRCDDAAKAAQIQSVLGKGRGVAVAVRGAAVVTVLGAPQEAVSGLLRAVVEGAKKADRAPGRVRPEGQTREVQPR